MTEGPKPRKKTWNRRSVLKTLGVLAGGASLAAGTAHISDVDNRLTIADGLGSLFQDHFSEMSKPEIEAALARLERRYKRRFELDIQVQAAPPIKDVLYGYALNLSKCKGYRDCVTACVKENNLSRSPEVQYIRVVELDQDTMDLETGEHYYNPETVPQAGKTYLPVQCHQCENPPCVRACPVQATWKEPDGIVVIDYDWCIGCRYCQAACPYWARHFNWAEPEIPRDEINTKTHYLSNRPREKGVMEKCTFCLHRVREGRQPACQEACPTGARIFGNLLDPQSEIRMVLKHKKVFRLKEDQNTEPKFWYYTD